MDRSTLIDQLTTQASSGDISESLISTLRYLPKETAIFSTSFSKEDQVITDLIATTGAKVTLFTLDTGRLFSETYSVWRATLERYKISIETFFPDRALLQPFVTKNGPNSFYESVANRLECCRIRKVEPLKTALHGKSLWISGLRSQHSPTRMKVPQFEWDEINQIIKYHPLIDWTDEMVDDYIFKHNVPYNSLYDRSFTSIGCMPCTRATGPGEDVRAGRWWWEEQSKKECGLHVHNEVPTR